MEDVPKANGVDEQVMKVQIPSGLKVGDSFIVTPPDGRVFTVIVPEGAAAGSFIDIIVPQDAAVAKDPKAVTMKKSTVGALALGGAVGLCFGPIGALVMAGAAVAAVSSKGKVGDTSRMVGEKTYEAAANAKNWTVQKANELKDKATGGNSSAERDINYQRVNTNDNAASAPR